MTNQTQKKGGTLNNLKAIYNLQSSGEILALLRNVRENISKADNLSNAFNSKMKEKAASNQQEAALAKVKAAEAAARQQEIAAEQARQAELQKQEQQKLAERELFKQQIQNIPQRIPPFHFAAL